MRGPRGAADSTRIPTASPSSVRICRAAASPSTVWVGGIRTSTTTTSGRSASHASSSASRLPPPRRSRSPPAGAARPLRRASARCPRPALRAREVHLDARAAARRAEHVERAAGGATRSSRPVSPEPETLARRRRRRRRSPRLADAPSAVVAATQTWQCARVLGDVGQRLRHREVRRRCGRARRLDRQRRSRCAPARGDRSTSDSRAACSPDSLEERRVDARGPARAPRRPRRSGRRPPGSAPLARRRCRRAGARAPARRRNAMVTSRCWVPSCRSRSMRRRSASPAAMIRAREAARSSSLSLELATAVARCRR